MGREIANIGFHRRMPETLEMEEVHLFERSIRGPMFERHAVCGDEHASAIIAKPTVNVDLFSRSLLKKREELNEFLVPGRGPAAGTNVDEAHSVFFGALSFRCDRTLAFAAKIDDGGEAVLFQLLDASFVGLRAAVKKIVDLSHVGNAAQLDFFSKGRAGGTARLVRASGTCATGNKKRRKKQNKDFAARVLHKERAFNHLHGNCKCKMRGKCGGSFKRGHDAGLYTGSAQKIHH